MKGQLKQDRFFHARRTLRIELLKIYHLLKVEGELSHSYNINNV